MKSLLKTHILLFIALAIGCLGSAAKELSDVDSLISELDRAIANRDVYVKQKRLKLEDMRREVYRQKDSVEYFHALGRLMDEFISFNTDSALTIANERVAMARRLGNEELKCHADLSLAHVQMVMGMYKETADILNRWPYELVPQYLHPYFFHINRTLYGNMADYAIRDEDRERYLHLTDINRDSIIHLHNTESLFYAIVNADRLNSHGQPSRGATLLTNFLQGKDIGEHDHAIAAYTLSESYRLTGDTENEKRQLIISAINDMQSGVREYVSLRKLALMLYKEGDVKHAYDYLKICMEDAQKCNARLRMLEINDIFPVVNEVYLDTIEQQKTRLRWSLAIVCLLAALLLVAIYLVYREMKKVRASKKVVTDMNAELQALNRDLEHSNDKLKEANQQIAENSYLKEEYIARYMDQCSVYIEKLDKYRKSLAKIVAGGRMDDLRKYTKTLTQLDDELRAFYDSFDDTFLKLFPTFVDDFNALLQPDERIVPKTDGKLNTELRIFALIRLGITDSVKIAQFLRYSVTTIYNYRTRVRNRAAGDRDLLEEELMKIGRIR